MFGIVAWSYDDHDCFAERLVMDDFTNPNNGDQVVRIGADESFLYENAFKIINPTSDVADIIGGGTVAKSFVGNADRPVNI